MNKVYAIQDKSGKLMYEEVDVQGDFVEFYQDLLGVRLEDICAVKP